MTGRAVRARFAPSPTGSLHVGGARTALYNYLFAKKHNGVFVLRVEDTDVARSTQDSETVIAEDLRWLGLEWDEGPGKNGKFGPYRQSERLSYYEKAGRGLKNSGLLYRCYCTEEELSSRRKADLAAGKTPVYDGTCRNLSHEELRRRGWENRKFAWRFNIGAAAGGGENEIAVNDLIHGEVRFEVSLIGDFIVIKSNEYPSYNFACVADDHGMNITHVIRGDEHLTNTPRQILLYRALGWNLPAFAHLPMILAADRTKLSKRHGTTAVGEFRQKGYLPHALLNYAALLGWSPKDERELFLPPKEYGSVPEAVEALLAGLLQAFSLEGVSRNSAVFDTAKLNWMNSQYLRGLSLDELAGLTLPLLKQQSIAAVSREKLRDIWSTQRNNFETLLDAVGFVEDFLRPESVRLEEAACEVLKWPWSSAVVAAFKKELEAADEITAESVAPLTKRVQSQTGKKGKDLFWPLRVAVTGKTHGPELVHLLPLLGKQEILQRLDKCQNIHG